MAITPIDEAPLAATDIGKTVYAVMAVEPLLLCMQCGAPDKRCDHSDHWALVDLPGIVSGPLVSMQANTENVTVLYQIDGIGMNQPLSAHRSIEGARAEVKAQFAKELALLVQWAGMS